MSIRRSECVGCLSGCDRIDPFIIIDNKKIECPCRICIVRPMCGEGIRTCEVILIYARNFRESFSKEDLVQQEI